MMDYRMPDMRQSHGSCVYFISAEDEIKIGTSKNVGFRLDELQTGRGCRLELLGVEFGNAVLERKLHLRFSHLRRSGEWFRKDRELIRYIESNAFHTEFSYFVANRYLDYVYSVDTHDKWVSRELWHQKMFLKAFVDKDVDDITTDWLRSGIGSRVTFWGDEIEHILNIKANVWLSIFPHELQKEFFGLKPMQQLVFVRGFALDYLMDKKHPGIDKPKQLPLF